LTGWPLEENPNALAVLPRVLNGLGLHPQPLEVAVVGAGFFVPVEKLGRGICLVVVLAPGKHRQFVEVFGEPRGVLGDANKAVLDQRGLRVQPHDLVGRRLVAGDRGAAFVDQLLDQLRAGGLVFDQHDRCLEQPQLPIGEYNFAGQYQQSPAPLGGGLVKAEWFKRYRQSELPDRFDRIVQSWDTANKATELSDFSVCTTWGVKGKELFLLAVFRQKLEYPTLK